jgi:hypothetical protein
MMNNYQVKTQGENQPSIDTAASTDYKKHRAAGVREGKGNAQ